MSATEEFVHYVLDLLEPLATSSAATISSKPFFGGKALRHESEHQESIQFAMIMTDTLYFCVDVQSRVEYEELGMKPFSYQTKNGVVQVKKYYAIPADWLEDENLLHSHAMQAINTARKLK